MTRRFSHIDAFVEWIGNNRRRLPTRLVLERKRADGTRRYWFPGAPDLRVYVWEGSLAVEVIQNRKYFDRLLDLDIEVKRDADGMYFCQWCADNGHEERYPDRTALLEAHTFEPFLEWCLENLREDKYLMLESVPDSCTSASIRDASYVEKHKSSDVICVVMKVLKGTGE